VILDANVVLNAVLPTRRTDQAVRALSGSNLKAPDFFYAEIGNGLSKQVRRTLIERSAAAELWARVLRLPIELLPLEQPELAMELSLELALGFYDACYLLLAMRADDRLVTDDRALVRNIAGRPELARYVVLLSDY